VGEIFWRDDGSPSTPTAEGVRRRSEETDCHSSNDCGYQIAEACAYRGENNEAFHWLDRAVRQCDAGAPELKRSPLMISLRKDPRYAGLLKQLHLAD
jgi:hypothetical protein